MGGQLRFDDPSDFRVLHDSFVSFTITKMLAARISWTIYTQSVPPPDVKPYDVEVKNTLALKFY